MRDSLRKPDISIVHQGVPTHPLQRSSHDHISHGNDKMICMAENKLKDKKAAVKQLEGYARDYGYESSPLMRLFTSVVGDRGLKVAMFRFEEKSDRLVPITDKDPSDGAVSYPACCDESMIQFALEVQSNEKSLQATTYLVLLVCTFVTLTLLKRPKNLGKTRAARS
ncbi:hypothetical protein BDP27DRAFT_1420243 [Rhodocollybia butyracea]|uniref:Uncharacterized protein n=1 Tax=Rhodocollybia butyracea TaxID=206335 RepID=A0A9P5U8S8_9AGAR|nr:hypothetical protein BDP27DRAFT_1420243 [Rhodocollybia butyracea]